MRLTCPNCGARYEVDDSMVPPEGRDVQCSNCTTTWFQPGLPVEAEVQTAPPPPEPPTASVDAYDDEYEESELQRREMDPDVLDVLRQEAQREEELRRSEAEEALQRQGEMALQHLPEEEPASDLDATISALVAEAAEDHAEVEHKEDDDLSTKVAETVSEAVPDVEEAATAAALTGKGSRRDLLPDIEEINSTLRATEDRRPNEPLSSDIDTVEVRPRRRKGLRIGFGLVVLLFAGLIMLYSNAPRISAAYPQTLPFLQAYVGQVDGLRIWIDEMAQGALPGGASEEEVSPPSLTSDGEDGVDQGASEPGESELETGDTSDATPEAESEGNGTIDEATPTTEDAGEDG